MLVGLVVAAVVNARIIEPRIVASVGIVPPVRVIVPAGVAKRVDTEAPEQTAPALPVAPALRVGQVVAQAADELIVLLLNVQVPSWWKAAVIV